MICRKSDQNSKQTVINSLKRGEVVVLPTDTVYGFSALVSDDFDTAEKIRKIKGREETKPFIQLIAKPEDIIKYTDDNIPESLLKYWPGPLTIIVNDKRYKNVTTAFRCPGDEWIRNIIFECECPIYSTSVNRSGKLVLAKESEITKEFEDEVNMIVLDGDCVDPVPSTIIKIDSGKINIIRQGKIILDII